MKLAEDMVTRGSFATTLNNQLLQNQSQINTPPPLNTTSVRRTAHVSPTITVHGNEAASYAGIAIDAHNSSLGHGNLGISNNSFNTGVISDAMSCVTEIFR